MAYLSDGLTPYRGIGRCASVLQLIFLWLPLPTHFIHHAFRLTPTLKPFFVMDPLQIPPTMAPPHLIKKSCERCLKCLITCNFPPRPLSTGGPSSVHKWLLDTVLHITNDYRLGIRNSMWEFYIWIFLFFELQTKVQKWVWWSMNDLRPVEKEPDKIHASDQK